MALPIVAGSENFTPGAAVKIDAGPLRQAALASGEVAGALGNQVGGFFDEVSQKIQANRNARTVFQADLAMRQTKDDFTAGLAKMPDETTWLPAYKQRVDEVRQSVLDGPNVGPSVKRMLTQKFQAWEQATTSEIRTAALLKGAKSTRDDAIAAATYAANQGDIAGAKQIMDAAVAHYAMSPDDAQRRSIKFPEMAARAQADVIISTDPIKAPELIKKFESTIEPRIFLGLQARAHEAKNRAQADNTNDLAQMLDSSPDGTIDPDLLKSKVTSGDITQRAANGLLARMDRTNLDHAKDTRALLMLAADDHDWMQDKDAEATRRAMKDEGAGLPAPQRRALYEHIDLQFNRGKRQDAADERPIQRDIFARGKQNFAQGLFRPATIQDVTTDEPGMLWGTNKKTEKQMVPPLPDEKWEMGGSRVVSQATINYARWQDQMRGFFKQNPDATSEQAESFSQQLMAPHVDAQVKRAINSPTQAPAGAHPTSPQFVQAKVYTDAKGSKAMYLGGDPANPDSWREVK